MGCFTNYNLHPFSDLKNKRIVIDKTCLYIDPLFSGVEKTIITKSFSEWSNKTENFFTFEYKDWEDDFQLLNDPDACNNNILISRAISTDQIVINAEIELKKGLWGYTRKLQDKPSTYSILIIADKIEDENTYRLITLHEFGHVIGLQHNDEISIMNTPQMRFYNGSKDVNKIIITR